MLTIDILNEMSKAKIKTALIDAFEFDYIQNCVEGIIERGLEQTDIYKYECSDHYFQTIDIIIPDRAGQFMEKELIELLLAEELDEREYLDNRIEYINFIENKLFEYTNELLREKTFINKYTNIYLDYFFGDISLYVLIEDTFYSKPA